MRLYVDEFHVDVGRHFGHDLRISIARRNREICRSWSVMHEVAQLWRMFCEYQTHTRAIGRRFADRGVMHVENEIRALRDELRRLEQTEILRAQSRIELTQSLRRFLLLQADAGCFVRLARNRI